MYFGDMYYDDLWSFMSKEYYVVIRQPKNKGPVVWTGPSSDVKSYKDMEGWNRIKDNIERRLINLGQKPEWVKSRSAFKVVLTPEQKSEVGMWGSDIKMVLEVT